MIFPRALFFCKFPFGLKRLSVYTASFTLTSLRCRAIAYKDVDDCRLASAAVSSLCASPRVAAACHYVSLLSPRVTVVCHHVSLLRVTTCRCCVATCHCCVSSRRCCVTTLLLCITTLLLCFTTLLLCHRCHHCVTACVTAASRRTRLSSCATPFTAFP